MAIVMTSVCSITVGARTVGSTITSTDTFAEADLDHDLVAPGFEVDTQNLSGKHLGTFTMEVQVGIGGAPPPLASITITGGLQASGTGGDYYASNPTNCTLNDDGPNIIIITIAGDQYEFSIHQYPTANTIKRLNSGAMVNTGSVSVTFTQTI